MMMTVSSRSRVTRKAFQSQTRLQLFSRRTDCCWLKLLSPLLLFWICQDTSTDCFAVNWIFTSLLLSVQPTFHPQQSQAVAFYIELKDSVDPSLRTPILRSEVSTTWYFTKLQKFENNESTSQFQNGSWFLLFLCLFNFSNLSRLWWKQRWRLCRITRIHWPPGKNAMKNISNVSVKRM